jgi:hypothetical protein
MITMKNIYVLTICIMLSGAMTLQAKNIPAQGEPEHYRLEVSNVYPIPATTDLSFDFQLARPAKVKVIIMDIMGRTVISDISSRSTGSNTARISLEELKNGAYFYTIEAENHNRISGRFNKI